MSARSARLLAVPFVVLAFVLRVGAELWVEPVSWRIETAAVGLLVALGSGLTALFIPLGAYLLLTTAARRPPTTWRTDPHRRRFAAPASANGAGPLAILAGWFAGGTIPTERVPNEDGARIAELGVATPIFFVVAVAGLLAASLAMLVNRPRLTLDPSGITLQSMASRVEIRWDELAPDGPPPPAKRRPAALELYRPAPSAAGPALRRRKLPAGLLHVDAAFLAYTIRRYVEFADHRPAIGTDTELAALESGFRR